MNNPSSRGMQGHAGIHQERKRDKINSQLLNVANKAHQELGEKIIKEKQTEKQTLR